MHIHTSNSPSPLIIAFLWPSREMLVISRQNGLCLLSSRLSGYRQKATRWSAAAMICTDRLRVKLKDLRGGVPGGRFFPFFFVGSCIVRTFCICGSPHGLLSCLSFSACVNGRDVRELDDLFYRTTIGIQRAFKLKKPEWPCGWEYKQAFSCLVASSGRLQIKEKDVPEIHCTSICPAKLYLQGPSVNARLFQTFSVQKTSR